MPFGRKQDRKIAGDHPNSFSLYFLIVCRLVFLFSLLCAVWQNTRSQNRRRPSNSFSLYCLILSLLAFLFSLLGAVWHFERVSPHCTSAPRASDLEINFYVFPHCVPASLFIFFTMCRLAENKIAKSQETIQINFLCISSLCAG